MREKYQAVLLNTALGDKLGMPVEGWKASQIKRYYGKITEPIKPDYVRDSAGNVIERDQDGRLKYYSISSGEDCSDDTILTLAIAESLAERGSFDLDDIGQKHIEEIKLRTTPKGKVLGGFGQTTQAAVQRIVQGISPKDSGILEGVGNGPAMKMSPMGLLAEAKNDESYTLIESQLAGLMTHLDPRSVVSGVLQANSVFRLLRGVDRKEFIDNFVEVGLNYEQPLTGRNSLLEDGSMLTRLSWIQKNKDISDEKAHEILGSNSLVYSSYPFTLFMLQKYWEDPVEGLVNLVNFGGDCDTTGAMYGALVGAKDGLVFPESWTDNISMKDRLIKAADGIYKLKGDR